MGSIRRIGLLAALSALAAAALLLACAFQGTGNDNPGPGVDPRTDTSGQCSGNCDAAVPSDPKLTDTSGYGDITTYGGITPNPSSGGACNYGSTGITQYAAMQVSRLPGDLQGQWREGRVCGQCVEVRARTPSGWKATVVRIVDKCPDGHCGIDLGGAPALALMGDKPGRYSGEWRFVSCEGHAGVSDGPPELFVKDGSNPYWSLVQVRNPVERILSMRVKRAGTIGVWTELGWATEAENFFKVPTTVLQDSADYDLEAALPHGRLYALRCKGSALAVAGAALPLAIGP